MSQDSVPRMISGCVLSIRFASSAVFATTEQQLAVIKRRGRLVCLFCLFALVGVECVCSNPKIELKLDAEWVWESFWLVLSPKRS